MDDISKKLLGWKYLLWMGWEWLPGMEIGWEDSKASILKTSLKNKL